MMKKTTSALAIAALLGTGAASAATMQINDDTTLSIGGDFQIVYKDVTDNNGVDQTTFGNNGTSLVFSGSHDAGNGLTTFFNLDLDGFDVTDAGSASSDTTNSTDLTVDEGSVGIRGSFGEVLVGSNGSVYDSYADFADIEQVGDRTRFVGEGDADDVIQYSNSVNGVDFTLEMQVDDDQDTANTSSSMAVGFAYDFGGVSVSGAYDERANTTIDEPVYGVAASTNLGGVDLTLGYEVDDQTNSIDKTSLTGSYDVGQFTLVGSVQSVSYDSAPTGAEDRVVAAGSNQTDDSFTETYAAVIYNVSGQMYVYGEVMMNDRLNDEGDYTALGVYYGW